MRLLICAGGTAGGVYPALSVLQALGAEANPVLWIGGESGMEGELVKRQNLPYAAIPAAGVHGVGLRALPRNLGQLARGTLAARRLIRQFNPDVMLFTGGYVAVPVALAGRSRPILLYVPDIEPGLALKTLARFADRIALTVPDSRAFFPARARTTVTGYPTRPELSGWTREAGREKLGLSGEYPVLLVTGGSKGARNINQTLAASLARLLPFAQIVHISGELDWPEIQAVQAALPASLAANYHPMPYLHEMGAALAAADLAVSRAGASTLGEYPLFGLPAVLVPYPYAWRYQRVNAEYLARAGAAVLLLDQQLESQLASTVEDLLRQPARLEAMRQAMRSLAHPGAADEIAALARELAGRNAQKGGKS